MNRIEKTTHATASAMPHRIASAALQDRLIVAVSAILLGSFLVFGVGLAHSDALHNAAHDARHTLAFPCH